MSHFPDACSTAQPRLSLMPLPIHDRFVQAGGARTLVLEAGAERAPGEAVVLIHGSGPGVSAFANWRLALPALGVEHRVVSYDQLGFGQTDAAPDSQYNLDVWTDHLLAVLDALEVERAHLVGNSMGAAVALAGALRAPERVGKLVLMGATGAPFTLTPGLDAVWGYEPSHEAMRELIDLFTYSDTYATDELVALRYDESVRPGRQEEFSVMFPEPRQDGVDDLAAPGARLAEIAAPTLLVHGREDQIIPLQVSLDLLQGLPNADLHVFGRCGHWTQTEHADGFHQLVLDFLA